MKLRDLVANSLPRVRGRKKKTTSVGSLTPTTPTPPEPPVHRPGQDKTASRYAVANQRTESRDRILETHGITEASWRGNALYRGLDTTPRGVENGTRDLASAYSSSHGIVTSHSAEGFSSQMILMSRSYDARMAVSDFNGSCSHMSSISETGVEPYGSKHEYHHCHYHQHKHHHHHHHHVLAKPMSPLVQNHQEMNACGVAYLPGYKQEVPPKPEPGFFRKSFASFKGMRKTSSRTVREAVENTAENVRCSVCPYPDTATALNERKATEKRPVKPKRKGLKSFSRSKENKEMISIDKGDKSWFSDNDAQNFESSSLPEKYDPSGCASTERPRVRECSVESCSSRLYGGSREGSCAREIDLTGFDSASLSGYESDLPRNKVHRSRSRIKTNPWLPSPQPSLSGGRRGASSDLRESREDIAFLDEPSSRFPRSASFEHQRSGAESFHGSSWNNASDNYNIQRHRSLTPNDVKMTFSCNKSPTPVKKSSWWSPHGLLKGDRLVTDSTAMTAVPTQLNDLNTEVPRSRPTSIVSPNSEFLKLADNLEQLANNISFEYEDMLDSTLESASVYQEDGQVSIQELLTDEENCGVAKRGQSGHLKSDVGTQSAHSPDSGIGCLGSSDGDDAATPCALTESKGVSMECVPAAQLFGNCGDNSVLCVDISHSIKDKSEIPDSKAVAKSSRNASSLFPKASLVSNLFRTKSQNSNVKTKSSWYKAQPKFDDESSATVSESDVDNTSYQEPISTCVTEVSQKKRGSPLPKCKIETNSNNKAPSLMVDERLDIQFQPLHRYIHGTGIVMGSRVSMHEYSSKVITGFGSQAPPPSRLSDPIEAIPRRIIRPCNLKTNSSSSQPGERRMNNMEKSSEHSDVRNSWSEELNFPRNITASECVESPTENWQCDGQLSMCSSQDTVVLEMTLDGTKATRGDAHDPEVKADNDHQTRSRHEDLFVRLIDGDDRSLTQSTVDMASENTSLMDCNLDKLDTSSRDQSFDMSDACVQTDFDDDFARWDEAGSLENFEEKAMDPAESTRLWLLTGNMQGSADTGYSSLTRDSQILMDEDTLFLAGELEEKAASERLSYAESSDRSVKSDKTPRTSFFDLDDSGLAVAPEKSRLSLPEFSNGGDLKNKLPGVTPNPSGVSETLATRSIPQETVNQMFSNIELQFQEIFQQIYEHEKTDCRRNLSDSSDTTLRSSSSDGTCCGEPPSSVTFEKHTSPKDAETGEKRNPDWVLRNAIDQKEIENDRLSLHDYVNIPSSRNMNSSEHCHSSYDVAGKSSRVCSFKPIKQNGSNRTDLNKNDVYSCDQAAPVVPVRVQRPNSERADYLEFLKDAPLKRTHLKRPLFLVPGVGPVDMSSSEQVNMFAKLSSPVSKTPSQLTCSPSSRSPSMSPLVNFSGKKQKFKTGSSKVLEDSLCQTERLQHLTSGRNCYDHLSFPRSPQDSVNQSRNIPPIQNKNRSPHGLVKHPNKGKDACESIHGAQHSVDPAPTAALSSKSPITPLSTVSAKPKKTPAAAGDAADIDNVRSLAAKVMFLRREKDIVYKKIQEAQEDEASRQQQRAQLQRSMQAQRKEALLKTLHDLRDKLQEQSQKLQRQDNSTTV
ncbi:unnamed protein product [Lymnaea stagnalis]|uniref:Uncharacterized protein n=1 Tax=Lymnaea stagnalis TaxID=6523 RepID=A0AAV2HGY5_LYMST